MTKMGQDPPLSFFPILLFIRDRKMCLRLNRVFWLGAPAIMKPEPVLRILPYLIFDGSCAGLGDGSDIYLSVA